MIFTIVWETVTADRAFHVFGLDFDTRGEPYRLFFDEEKLRGRAGLGRCGP
jgi:hypothetical protein